MINRAKTQPIELRLLAPIILMIGIMGCHGTGEVSSQDRCYMNATRLKEMPNQIMAKFDQEQPGVIQKQVRLDRDRPELTVHLDTRDGPASISLRVDDTIEIAVERFAEFVGYLPISEKLSGVGDDARLVRDSLGQVVIYLRVGNVFGSVDASSQGAARQIARFVDDIVRQNSDPERR